MPERFITLDRQKLRRIALSFFSLFWSYLSSAQDHQPSLMPTLSLDHFNPDVPLELNGPWMFFPNEFVEPDRIFEKLSESASPLQSVLGRSFAEIMPDRPHSSFGFGTYVLLLDKIPQSTSMAMQSPRAYTACRVFWVDADQPSKARIIMKFGEPGMSAETSVPGMSLNIVARIPTESSRAAVVVHLSNHYHYWGGLWKAPTLGSSEKILANKETESNANYLIIGILMFISFSNLSLYLRRREDLGSLWLTLLSLLIAARALSNIGALALIFGTPSDFLVAMKIIYISMAILPAIGFLFLGTYFPKQFKPWYTKLLIALGLIFSAIIFLTASHVYTRFSEVLITYNFISLAWAGILIIKVFGARENGAVVCFIGLMCLILGSFMEGLSALGIIPGVLNSMAYGLAAFVSFQSQIVAARFVAAFRQSEHLSRELQREVDRQTRDIRSILDNLKQGIFTLVHPSLKIGPQFSPFTRELLSHEEVEGISIEQILLDHSNLGVDERSQIRSALNATLGEDSINFELNSAVFPRELVLKGQGEKVLEVDWSPIVGDESQVEKILVCIRDVTEVRSLRREAERNQRDFNILQELVSLPEDRFARFLNQAHELLAENISFLENDQTASVSVARRIFVNLHTLKGVARTIQCRLLSNITHNAEQYLTEFLRKEKNWDWELLLHDNKSLLQCLDEYKKVAVEKLRWNLTTTVVKFNKADIVGLLPQIKNLSLEVQSPEGRSALASIGSRLMESCYARLNEIILDASRAINSIAKDLRKQAPEIVIGPNQFLLVDGWADRFHGVMTHVFRNAIDHGIETPQERQKAGKAATSHIFVRVSLQQSWLRIEIQDDGRGLNLIKIEAKAQEKGLWPDAANLDDPQIAAFIFHAGLSTKDHTNEISGRGVGMDAIRAFVEEGGGVVNLMLEPHFIDRTQVPFSLLILLPESAWVEATSVGSKVA